MILQRDNEYTSIAAGATMDKNAARETLSNKAMYTIDALRLYGNKSGNEQLKAECRLSHSKVQKMNVNALLQLCVRISGFAKTYANEIIPYGVSAEDIEALEKAMEQFSLKFDAFQLKMAESKASRGILTQSFRRVDGLLKENIDTFRVGMLKDKDPDLYTRYQAARTGR